MTGRGIDQLLPHPSDPVLHEPFIRDATAYVMWAERAGGPISRPVDYEYPWGEALQHWDRVMPDVRIVNLETSVTRSSDPWLGKDIHYRMNPQNIACIAAAKIDCCSLANNHVLDWGYAGLAETLLTLRGAGIKTAGAGTNGSEAETPAELEIPDKGRVLLFAFASQTSGVPSSWAAGENRPGVILFDETSESDVLRIQQAVVRAAREHDVIVASLHWGSNWGYKIPQAQRRFARALIDWAGVHVVYGHSSHHVKGMEIYRGRLILYGCGDFLDDYEGISEHDAFRPDLGVLYFATLNLFTGDVVNLQMMPTQIHRMRIRRPPRADIHWLRDTLNRESQAFGARVELSKDQTLALRGLSAGRGPVRQ